MKKCFKCNEEKPINSFYHHKKMKDGYLSKCKECTKSDNKNYPNSDLTEHGVIRIIYKTQKRNCKIRKMDMPNYSKLQLKEWLYENGFKELFDIWSKSGYKKNFKPSIDRLDDFKSYSFDNIKLGTWLDNKNHQVLDILNGLGTGGKRCKPVIQLHNNRIVAKYHSYSSAERTVKYDFHRLIDSGIPDKQNGYLWYREEYLKQNNSTSSFTGLDVI